MLSHTCQHCKMLIKCFLNKSCFKNSNSVCSATLPIEDAVPAKPPLLHREPSFLNPLIKTPRRMQSSRVASGAALSSPHRCRDHNKCHRKQYCECTESLGAREPELAGKKDKDAITAIRRLKGSPRSQKMDAERCGLELGSRSYKPPGSSTVAPVRACAISTRGHAHGAQDPA